MLLLGIAGYVVPLMLVVAGAVLGRWLLARVLGAPVPLFTAGTRGGRAAGQAAAGDAGSGDAGSGRGRWRRRVGLLGCPAGAYLATALLSGIAAIQVGDQHMTREVVPLEGSVAKAAGMRAGDLVVAVDGKPVQTWEELRAAVGAVGDRDSTVVVVRSGRELTMPIRPVNGRIGVSPTLRRTPMPLPAAVHTGVTSPFKTVAAMVAALGRLVSGGERVEVGGPVRIVRQVTQSTEGGIASFLMQMAALASFFWLPNSLVIGAALLPRAAVALSRGAVAAGREARLFAYFIDYLLCALVAALWTLPGLLLGSGTAAEIGGWFGLAACLTVQWVLVARTGQSIGKWWLGLRIVRTDGSPAGFVRGVALRSWTVGLAGAVPFAGIAFVLLDSLFVFAGRGRCLHDYLADTVVARIGGAPAA